MLLFHGTGKTDPKIIYEDNEQCFNINYSDKNNLLGRGIYFAERSEYSANGYAFVETQNEKEEERIYSMLYCEVLVGNSKKWEGQRDGNFKDTPFKDEQKKLRYESMTDFLEGSNIYVVYKSKRAYPLYLIKYKKLVKK